MQALFTLYKEGFNQSVKPGEIIEYNKEKWVLTYIFEVKKFYSNSIKIQVKGVAQMVDGNKFQSKIYEQSSFFTRKYIKGESSIENPIYKSGDLFIFDGVCGQIESIESVHYDFLDMIIKYKTRLVKPWSKEEMDQAFQKYRLSKFKIIHWKKFQIIF